MKSTEVAYTVASLPSPMPLAYARPASLKPNFDLRKGGRFYVFPIRTLND